MPRKATPVFAGASCADAECPQCSFMLAISWAAGLQHSHRPNAMAASGNTSANATASNTKVQSVLRMCEMIINTPTWISESCAWQLSSTRTFYN